MVRLINEIKYTQRWALFEIDAFKMEKQNAKYQFCILFFFFSFMAS